MKCLPVNMVACLANSASRSSLEESAETADKIQELYDRSSIHGVEIPAPSLVTLKQFDVLTKLVEKLKPLVLNTTSSHRSKQRSPSLRRSGSSFKHRNQICYCHRTY